MKRNIYNMLLLSVGIISVSITSCEKAGINTDLRDLTSVDETVIAAETIFDTFTDLSSLTSENNALFSVSAKGNQTMSVPQESNSCIQLNISPQNMTWPLTLTMDYGTGCTVENITRKGKMIAVFSDRFKNPGAKITVTFENFQVNDHKIEGTKIITNNGKNAAGNLNFTIEVAGSKISTADKSMSFSSTNNIEWTAGSDTFLPGDDVFSISGSAKLTNSKGKELAVSIVKPLIKKAACRFVVAGSTDIKAGDAMWTLDYGSGDCDNKASVNILGEIKEITLRK